MTCGAFFGFCGIRFGATYFTELHSPDVAIDTEVGLTEFRPLTVFTLGTSFGTNFVGATEAFFDTSVSINTIDFFAIDGSTCLTRTGFIACFSTGLFAVGLFDTGLTCETVFVFGTSL
tara:strand:+ start:4980 stop:5333 length:354 start_codon:yes stop_codon:yes gene_type:complete